MAEEIETPKLLPGKEDVSVCKGRSVWFSTGPFDQARRRQPHSSVFGDDSLYLHSKLISQAMKRFNLRSPYFHSQYLWPWLETLKSPCIDRVNSLRRDRCAWRRHSAETFTSLYFFVLQFSFPFYGIIFREDNMREVVPPSLTVASQWLKRLERQRYFLQKKIYPCVKEEVFGLKLRLLKILFMVQRVEFTF
ncbi:hypothetical protein CDAR_54481 [Caerostris darwini]|uniref:Maturase K n=1 Tax=Caerostris darwini TaxID=1538125 RepID=A0AAV4T3Y1_9ARAC|nr:hypothetical protein CDAR_54481 [Caerostris darwini]